MSYVVTFADGARHDVEADSRGAARAKAQEIRFFHNGKPPYREDLRHPDLAPWRIVSVKEFERA